MIHLKQFVACTAGRKASCVVGVIRLVHAEALSGVNCYLLSGVELLEKEPLGPSFTHSNPSMCANN